ncbi:DNA topoisomerase III [Lelliottia aquatilis]|uniref:type IA DNA topoisomerase n=1 Tax=Lelliottia aquatilis TaxID=2080838 RepID=UPI0015750749|nr:type IA DNA topoisomerase [Lelliottia aquatilis]NTZ47712.1 DNA topoisomerase III [Lelliottia aquatilis]
MRLFIAEKPSVATDIVKALGGQFTRHDGYFESATDIVSYCVGHILEMVPPEVINPAYKAWALDTLPLKLYPVQLQPKEGTAKQAATLIGLIKRPDLTQIVHCGDPDDEGQLLVDEVLEYSGNMKPVKRALINDNTAPAVKKALNSLKDNKQFHGLYLKALARSVGDAIYGFSMTRAYTIKAKAKGYGSVLSVGRVQTPVLGLVVRRWRDFTAHTSSFYYTLTGNFLNGPEVISARWQTSEHAPVDDKNRLNNKQWAEGLAKSMAGKPASVLAAAVDTGKEQSAPLPFNLVRLQQYMNLKHKLTAQQTLDITQGLREKHKAITYNRSDCSYLSDEQYAESPALINALKSLNDFSMLDTDTSRKSKAFDSKKVTAHTAIIPTLNTPDLAALSVSEKAVYIAIVKFYLAQFMPKKTYDEASVMIKCGDESFAIRSRKTTNVGFTSLLGEEKDDDEPEEENGAFDALSSLRTGEDLTCKDVDVSEQKTKPQPLFTEASLLAALVRVADFVSDPRIKQLLKEKDKDKKDEHGGIGTPATRAGIIETLKKRNYITVEKGKFIPTDAGVALIDALPDVATQPDMTALWAEKQAEIESGTLSIDVFVNDLYGEITRLVENADIQIAASEKAPSTTLRARLDVKCPSCGSDIIAGPKVCSCTGCAFKIWTTLAGKTLTQKQIETVIAKGKSGEIKGFTSTKTGKSFSAFVVLKDKTTGSLGFEFPPRDDKKPSAKDMPRELKL